MQQPTDPFQQFQQPPQWPQPPNQNTNYTMQQYQTPPLYQMPIQSPMMPPTQKHERPANQTMKSMAIVLFLVALGCNFVGLAFTALEVLASLLYIVAFVCVCLI
jgi:hypothetical protein